VLVLNLKVNPSKCVAEDVDNASGVYGSSRKRTEAPKKLAAKSSVRSAKPVETPVVKQEVEVAEPVKKPEIKPVQVTQLTDEQKKYLKVYEKMHRKEIDTSEYKIKVYIAQTKEQSREKPRPPKRTQAITPEIVNPEVITPETINVALPGVEIPEEVKKTNWFKRLFEKIKEFFRKLFKRKEAKSNGGSEDISS
jgi:lysyl-tRNA synthetase class I